MTTDIITPVISTATIISHGMLVLFLFVYGTSSSFRVTVQSHIYDHIYEYIFLISLSAFVGSIAYSNLIGFPPCDLCWWARILMYPQVVFALIAYIKKDRSFVSYLLPLSIMGALLTTYHSFVLLGGKSILPCTQVGSACSKLYVLEYGYVTIPMMALTIFVYLIVTSLIYNQAAKNK